jgi:hypothetical protein
MLQIRSQSTVPRMIIQIFNGSEKGVRCDCKIVRFDFEIILYDTEIVPFDFKTVRYDVEIVHYDPENTSNRMNRFLSKKSHKKSTKFAGLVYVVFAADRFPHFNLTATASSAFLWSRILRLFSGITPFP